MQNKRTVRKAVVRYAECVACGCCVNVCPKYAVKVSGGVYAQVENEKCIGCGICVKECPASVIELKEMPS